YHLFFILEYCSGGDLISLIIEKPFLKEQVLYYSAVALSCLDFLHNESIIYRDLKLDNICLKHDGTPRLVDFGLSKVDIKLGAYTNTFCGTYVFLPPEMFLGPEYNHTLDYWQLGSLIYTMKYRSNPFIADTDELLAKEICNSYLKFPNDDDPLLNDIILCLMKKNPEERLGSIINKGALGVKKHAYFSTINWMKLGSKDCHIPYIPTMKDEYGLNNFPSCSKHKASSSSNIDSVQQNIIAANEYLFENF
ncbi:MAG: Serine/threonine-protein kinase pkn3, partial [Marteilia pararefringens]